MAVGLEDSFLRHGQAAVPKEYLASARARVQAD
jgi:hypothetical protein